MQTSSSSLRQQLLSPLLLAALSLAPPALAQRFVVLPSPELLSGAPVEIRLSGLPPRAEVSVRASRTLADLGGSRRLYSAEARFTADADGSIDLATQAPAAGSYGGADVRGLFWSMAPVDGASGPAPPALRQPVEQVLLQARLAGSGARAGRLLAEQRLTLNPSLPSVASRPAEGFEGAVFASLPGAARRPALIVLGGSEGGARITRDAPVWASRGFAVLALPSVAAAGWSAGGPTPAALPGGPAAFADIAVDGLQAARDWLVRQPEVDATRIGVMGTSEGAEFALIAASRRAWVKSVVAIVPSDAVRKGWNSGDIVAPLLVAGSQDDQVWDSGGMANSLALAHIAAGRETVALIYRDAGHCIGGDGFSPTTQSNAGPKKSGGTPQANAQAQAEVFTQTLEFLRRTLGPVPD